MIMEEEQMNDNREDKESQEISSPMEEWLTVIMTGRESVRGPMPDREIGNEGLGFSELGSSGDGISRETSSLASSHTQKVEASYY